MESVHEIDLEIERLQRLRIDLAAAEAERQRREGLKEAYGLTEDLVRILERLYELGFVPPKLMAALTNSEGNFRPGMFIKRPRLRDEDTSEESQPRPSPSSAAAARRRARKAAEKSAEPSPSTQEEELELDS